MRTCPAGCSGGEVHMRESGQKMSMVCRVCEGNYYLPEDHPAFQLPQFKTDAVKPAGK